MSDRVHVLDGAHNVRDLGGLATRDGRRVRAGLMFRSDYPGFVDVDDGAVARLGLRTVVDLRGRHEVEHERVAWEEHGVDYLRSSVVADVDSSWHASYPGYLTRRPETVVAAVRRVLDPRSQPVLFHCAAGKDRTGVVAALVLAVLGVPEDEIVADYVLSEASVPSVLARLAAAGPYRQQLATTTVADQLPRAEVMVELLRVLRDQGGAEAWLVAHGTPAEELAAAREAALEPAPGAGSGAVDET